jgi:hypothetical protein
MAAFRDGVKRVLNVHAAAYGFARGGSPDRPALAAKAPGHLHWSFQGQGSHPMLPPLRRSVVAPYAD